MARLKPQDFVVGEVCYDRWWPLDELRVVRVLKTIVYFECRNPRQQPQHERKYDAAHLQFINKGVYRG